MFDFLSHPLVFNFLILFASFFVLFKSADLILLGISNYARRLGLSDAVIGLVVIAMAASSPEIVSSLTGFLSGDEGVGFGVILGSNIVHAGFALGMVLLIGRKLKIEPNVFTKHRVWMWLALLLPLFLAFVGGGLSRFDGFVLIFVFVVYLVVLWRTEGTLGKMKKDVELKHIWRDVLVFLGSFVALILAGRWLVISSVHVADFFSIPSYFVALTVLGFGGALPDFAVEIKSVVRKHASVGLGDLFGSLAIQLIFFFGVIAVFHPLKVDVAETFNAVFWLAVMICFLMFVLKRKFLTWKSGVVLLVMFACFLAIEILKVLR